MAYKIKLFVIWSAALIVLGGVLRDIAQPAITAHQCATGAFDALIFWD